MFFWLSSQAQQQVILFGDNPIGCWDYFFLTIIPFMLQAIHVIHLIVCQVTVDIFFIDWERPADSLVYRLRGLIPTASMWRVYFIMRKWNELQTVRRINPAFQMFASLSLLVGLGLGNLATEDPLVDIFVSAKTYRAATTTVFRFACFSTVYLLVGQYFLILLGILMETLNYIGNLSFVIKLMITRPNCGAWWLIGRFVAFRPKGRGFESSSSCHVGTLDKSFTRSCLWCFGAKLQHSIRAVSGAPLSSSGLEEAQLK